MKNLPTQSEITKLFDNTDPDIVWLKASSVIRRINPDYDFEIVCKVYQDVLRLFYGEFPGYGPIKTLYHDLSHTLEVFMCGVRLMHGVHASGNGLRDDELTQMMLAILMHDVGYAQREGEETGSGAQFTRTHVRRGVEFMEHHFAERMLPADILVDVTGMILGTEHFRPFDQINFKSDRSRMLACIVATADITGQMADRKYLEKLLFLYQEFKEAGFGNYQSMFDLLRQTSNFYALTREKLDGVLGGTYKHLSFHFQATMGVENNFYIEAIAKNMAYLEQVIARGEQELFTMLKRNNIAESARLIQQIA
jgi:hypothetical protein